MKKFSILAIAAIAMLALAGSEAKACNLTGVAGCASVGYVQQSVAAQQTLVPAPIGFAGPTVIVGGRRFIRGGGVVVAGGGVGGGFVAVGGRRRFR